MSNQTIDYLELLQGVAFYDTRGLPQKLFTVKDQSIRWTEQAFQVLGMEHFIGQTLGLPRFDYGMVTRGDSTIVITRQGDGYVACLSAQLLPDLVLSLPHLTQECLMGHPRFVNL